MAIAGSGPEIENEKKPLRERNLAQEWIAETDNVKDIKENLSALKGDIFDAMKKGDKNKDILGTKFIDNKELFNQALDQQFLIIDQDADDEFDTFARDHQDELNAIIQADDTTAKMLLTELQNEFNDYLSQSSDIKNIVNGLKELVGESVKFELNDLRYKIHPESGAGTPEYPTTDGDNPNPFLNDEDAFEKDKKKESKENITTQYVDSYKDFGYAKTGEGLEIQNIYKDNRVRKIMESIFEDEKGKEIRKGMFNINLDQDTGLVGIIIALREAAKQRNLYEGDVGYNAKYKAIYEGIQGIDFDEDVQELSLPKNDSTLRKNLKKLIDAGSLVYERKGGIDNELGKIAKILSRAEWKKLDTFASLVQSNPDIAMVTKEIYNANEITGQNQEKKERKIEQGLLIHTDNVLEYLCDINGDGMLSASYAKKNNKEQKYQGDVGTLFGQQMMFTIDQAIKVQNVELGEPQGEQLVISNILKNMSIADSRNLENTHLVTMQKDPTKCTRENLAKLINGSEDDGIYPMPEMKMFFLDALKKINGGSEMVQPDLYDTLVGKETKNIINLDESEAKLKETLDVLLSSSEYPEIKKTIREQGLVRVRQTLFTHIMTALDTVEITTNNGARTSLQAAGISKGWEAQHLKKELLEKATATLIATGIHYSKTGGLLLNIGYGKNGTSESGKTKRARGTGAGAELKLGIGGSVGIFVDLGGEIAEQYNHNKVINADLSHVKSAQYFGIEAGARAGIDFRKVKTLDAEASAGINRQRDLETGINQIDKQYENISAEIFTIESAKIDTILTSKENCKKYFDQKIEGLNSDPIYGKFITTNEETLKSEAAFIVRYMAANELFGSNSLLAKKTSSEKKSALTTLFDILQSGAREQRRHDVIAGLHGKIALTKLSFGVTTNALTMKIGKTKEEQGLAPTASSQSGETLDTGTVSDNAGYGTSEGSTAQQDKFGIAGFYIGARISTWKNMYVPHDKQYLFTEYEIGQGLGAEKINNLATDPTIYARYLEALYNDPKGRLSCSVDAGRLVITFDQGTSDITLAKFLNIHATDFAQPDFSLKGNTLIIGNVGAIGAYTVTEANGVRRTLCLGSKKLDETVRLTGDNATIHVDALQDKPTGKNLPRTKESIQTNIINTMTGNEIGVEKVKAETSAFIDENGKLKKPTSEERENIKIIFENNIEGIALQQGTLTITKNTDGTYLVQLDDRHPANRLKIRYLDQKEIEDAAKDVKKEATKTSGKTMETVPKNFETRTSLLSNTNKLFVSEGDMFKAETLLDTLSDSIKDLEKNKNKTNKKEYLQFLSASSNIIDSDGSINDQEITEAIGYLKILLPDNSSKLTELRGYLNSTDGEVKSYIVDRMKQIFAKDEWYTGKTLARILASHNRSHTKWESLTGPSEEVMDKNLQNELKIQRTERAKSTKMYNENPTVDPNLIGYTSFYRNYGSQYKNQKFSITSLGNTTSQVEPYPIKENKESAKKWFLGNLEKNQYEVEYLATCLENKIKEKGVEVYLLERDPKDTRSHVKNLLEGNTLTIDSGEKISIDIGRVFYLLGDCCNESLGMKIKNIQVTALVTGNEAISPTLSTNEGKDGMESKRKHIVVGEYTADGKPVKEYQGGIDLFTKSHSISSRVLTRELKVGIEHHQNSKDKIPTPSTSDTGPGGTTDGGVIQAGTGGDEG